MIGTTGRPHESRPACSPDGTERNPGPVSQVENKVPDFASLHPGYGSIFNRVATNRAIAAGAWSGIANTELTLISHST